MTRRTGGAGASIRRNQRTGGARRLPPSSLRIGLKKLDLSDEGPLRPEDGFALKKLDDILYFFTRAATKGVINAAWARALQPEPGVYRIAAGLYARTAHEVFFFPGYRSVGRFRRERRPRGFISIHQSLLVNADRIAVTDGKPEAENLVGLDADGRIEWVQASRRAFTQFRRLFAFPLHRTKRSKATGSARTRPNRAPAAPPPRSRRKLRGIDGDGRP